MMISFFCHKGSFIGIDATVYCPDPLNIQTGRTDGSTSNGGIVTCGSTLTNPGCGVCS